MATKIPKNIIGTKEDSRLRRQHGPENLSQIDRIIKKAKLCQIKITTAESITGGGVFNRLISLYGASQVMGTAANITYSDAAKQERFGIADGDIREHSVVSMIVAKQMALAALEESDANLAVSTTGFAGPSLTTPFPKPPGTLFIAIAFQPLPNESPIVIGHEYKLSGKDRTNDITEATNLALNALEDTLDRHLKKEGKDVPAELTAGREISFYTPGPGLSRG
jgi:nicotinamide-nucleotide amidase